MGHIEKSQSGHRAHLFGFAVGYVVCLEYWLPGQEGWQDDFLRVGVGMICAIASNRVWGWWAGRKQSTNESDI